jgi:hypothetical protein
VLHLLRLASSWQVRCEMVGAAFDSLEIFIYPSAAAK